MITHVASRNANPYEHVTDFTYKHKNLYNNKALLHCGSHHKTAGHTIIGIGHTTAAVLTGSPQRAV